MCEDFEIIFAKDEVASKKVMLSEGCLVMDSLGNDARSRLITWYCNTQLREYRQVFKGNDEVGGIHIIGRRFELNTYEAEREYRLVRWTTYHGDTPGSSEY